MRKCQNDKTSKGQRVKISKRKNIKMPQDLNAKVSKCKDDLIDLEDSLRLLKINH